MFNRSEAGCNELALDHLLYDNGSIQRSVWVRSCIRPVFRVPPRDAAALAAGHDVIR
jgi:hypothetical protein